MSGRRSESTKDEAHCDGVVRVDIVRNATGGEGSNMKRRRMLFVIVTTMCCYSLELSSQVVLNPGIKLGHTFGENGGFTWGLEVSLTSGDGPWFGGVVDIDFCKERTKFHIGFQGSMIAGASLGPTFIVEKGETDVGISVVPFAGAILYPYYAFTLRPKKSVIHEAGGFLKVPIAVSGALVKL